MVPVEILNTTGSGLQLLSALTLPQNLLSCFGGAVLILFQNHFGVHDDPVLQAEGTDAVVSVPKFYKREV